MNEAAEQNWSSRALDRQIGTLYYERLLVSQDKQVVTDEASQQLVAHQTELAPKGFVRDPHDAGVFRHRFRLCCPSGIGTGKRANRPA